MLQLDRRSQKGQVLVMVALGLLALVAIVALAVDGGHLYAERRRMQSAADSGALAGARVLCFEEFATASAAQDEAEDQAEIYAQKNGAVGVDVSFPDDLTVTVVATETTDTFFARVIGFPTADVSAIASAMCQAPAAGGNIWPLAVKESVYMDTDTIPCGGYFYAYVDSGLITTEDCDIPRTQLHTKPNVYGECTDDGGTPLGLPDVTKVQHLDSANRGWLDLQVPLEPYPDVCKNESCGVPNVQCWLANGHPGPVNPGDCLYTESGGQTNPLGSVINTQCDKIYNLVLFDRTCTEELDPDEDRWYSCGTPQNNAFYHVSAFGCIKVIGFYEADFACTDIPPGQTTDIPVAIVQKMCETYPDDYWVEELQGRPMPGYADSCIAFEPGTGNPPRETDPRTIQLIQ
ncbi:MAG: pilus assembly protein TadG-related protein [Anaerolineae bacterium]